jgi:mRNA interferase HigB
MTIIGRQLLNDFVYKDASVRSWIQSWLADVDAVKWRGPLDIRKRYAKVSFLSYNVAILDVKGSDCKLEVQVAYNTGIIIVKWTGPDAKHNGRL